MILPLSLNQLTSSEFINISRFEISAKKFGYKDQRLLRLVILIFFETKEKGTKEVYNGPWVQCRYYQNMTKTFQNLTDDVTNFTLKSDQNPNLF